MVSLENMALVSHVFVAESSILTHGTMIYYCFRAMLRLNAELSVFVDNNQWYFCSPSCFSFTISQCHTCSGPRVFTWVGTSHPLGHIEAKEAKQYRDCDILPDTGRQGSRGEKEKLEKELIMLPWPQRSGTGRKLEDTVPNCNRGLMGFETS